MLQLTEFRQLAGKSLPVIPKSGNQGRNNFDSLKDLADYLEAEDEKNKHNIVNAESSD